MTFSGLGATPALFALTNTPVPPPTPTPTPTPTPIPTPAPTTGGVLGTVFSDVQFSGILTPLSLGLAGLTVFVDLNNNGVLDSGEPSAVTDGAGDYSFANLGPGTYQIEVANNNPSERFTLPTGGSASTTITAGQTTTQNFGVFLFGFAGVVPSTPGLFSQFEPGCQHSLHPRSV